MPTEEMVHTALANIPPGELHDVLRRKLLMPVPVMLAEVEWAAVLGMLSAALYMSSSQNVKTEEVRESWRLAKEIFKQVGMLDAWPFGEEFPE